MNLSQTLLSAALLTASFSLTASADQDPLSESFASSRHERGVAIEFPEAQAGGNDNGSVQRAADNGALTFAAGLPAGHTGGSDHSGFRSADDSLSYDDQNPDAATACDGDLTLDDVVDWEDFLTVLWHWGSCDDDHNDFQLRAASDEVSLDDRRCAYDIDDDGEVGFQEMITVLAQWGSCS